MPRRSEHFVARSSPSRHDIIAVDPLKGLKRLRVDDDERVRFLAVAEENRFRDALVKPEANLRAARDRFNEHRIAGTSPRCPRERLSTWTTCGRRCARRTKQAARYLSDHGVQTSQSYLEKCRGRGPDDPRDPGPDFQSRPRIDLLV